MSAISELIEQLEREDEIRQIEDEKHFEEQDTKYEELRKRIDFYKDEMQKNMDNIVKGLDKLVANKHTIINALEQTENLTGLPVPQEQHSDVVDLFAKMTGFLNTVNNGTSISNVIYPDEIHQDVVNAMERVEIDLKDCHTEAAEAQALLFNTKSLENLITESNDDAETQRLDDSLTMETIIIGVKNNSDHK